MAGKAKWFAILALAVGTSLAAATPDRAPEAPQPAVVATGLDALFNKLGVPYSTSGDNWYKAIWAEDGKSTTMHFNLRELGTLTDGTKLTSVVMYVPLINVPSGTTPSASLLKKIGDINSALDMGSVTFVPDAGGVFYQSSFWLNDATENTLNYQMLYASLMAADITAELKPFVAN